MNNSALVTVTSHDSSAMTTVVLPPELDRDQPGLCRLDVGELDSVGGFRGGVESHAREARDVRGVERNSYRVSYDRGEITNAHVQGLHLSIAEPGRIRHLDIDRSARCVGVRLRFSEDAE